MLIGSFGHVIWLISICKSRIMSPKHIWPYNSKSKLNFQAHKISFHRKFMLKWCNIPQGFEIWWQHKIILFIPKSSIFTSMPISGNVASAGSAWFWYDVTHMLSIGKSPFSRQMAILDQKFKMRLRASMSHNRECSYIDMSRSGHSVLRTGHGKGSIC